MDHSSSYNKDYEEEDYDVPMKIHPKKDPTVLGSLAAASNSWYENEKDEDDDERDEDDEDTKEVNTAESKRRKLLSSAPTFPVMTRTIPSADSSVRIITPQELLATSPELLIAGQSNRTLAEIIVYANKLSELAEAAQIMTKDKEVSE